MQKRVLLVFGTRPEVIKLAPLILAIKNSPLNNCITTVSTSQHDELLDEQLQYWGIIPDYFLTPSLYKNNLTRLLAHTISGLQDIIEQIKTIEYIIVQGDTNTALACSNLSFLNQLKLIHIEAGLRSFNFKHPFPEEYNRIMASNTAYFHFAPTELAKENLLKEGVFSEKVEVVGNTVVDALQMVRKKAKNQSNSEPNTVLITMHRRENISEHYEKLIEIVHELADLQSDLRFVWITHPNNANKIKAKLRLALNIEIYDHMPYETFINHYNIAKMIITDSGGVSEEAMHLGIPLVIFRLATERVEALKEGYPMLVSVNKNEIISFFKKNLNQINTIQYSYGDGNASQKIIKWLLEELVQYNYDVTIIGGGPAGTGVLLKAIKDGPNTKLFNKKIALIEKTPYLVKGNLIHYKVNSDTLSDVFLECLEGHTGSKIDLEKLKNEITELKKYSGTSIPLTQINSYFTRLGELIKFALEQDEKCHFYMNTAANKIIQKANGGFEIFFENQQRPVKTKKLIITTGGIPKMIHLEYANFAKQISLSEYENKSYHADTILRSGLTESIKLQLKSNPKVVILGGSHSAFSVAHFLLNFDKTLSFSEADIKIWCNNPPKLFFNTKEEALNSGYNDFTENDICPVTQKLFRLAGLRMDGRNLYMQMLGLQSSKKELRVKLKVFKNDEETFKLDVTEATLIVFAYGYRLNMFPCFTEKGEQIRFMGEVTNHWVNKNCELIKENGEVIQNMYASGLATGFIPNEELGGEPSFQGQTNGIWYYQNAIAAKILNHLEREHSPNMS